MNTMVMREIELAVLGCKAKKSGFLAGTSSGKHEVE